MNLSSLKEIGAYVLVSLLAVGLAASLSLQFLKPAASQEEQENFPQESPPVVEETPASDLPPSDPPASSSDFPPSDLPPESNTVSSAREIEVFLEPFIYDSKERRNPFEPYQEIVSEAAAATPVSALQKYRLDELKLIGIMWDIRSPKAMFVDPKSVVHVVGRDESIGRKNGYIAAIREGEVVVVEAEQTEAGIVYETKVLRLEK